MKPKSAIVARLETDQKTYLAHATATIAGGQVGVLSNTATTSKANAVGRMKNCIVELDAAIEAVNTFGIPEGDKRKLQLARNEVAGAAAFVANSLRSVQ